MRAGTVSGLDRAMLARLFGAALLVAVAAWSMAIFWPVAPWAPLVVPVPSIVGQLMVAGLATAAFVLMPHVGEVRWAFGLALATVAAFIAAFALEAQPVVVAIVPALGLAGLIGARFPVATIVGAVAVCGFQGTFLLYVWDRPRIVYDLLLLAFLAGALGRTLFATRGERARSSGALMLLVAYVSISAFTVLASPSVVVGFQAFRGAQYFMLIGIVIGFVVSDREQRWRLLKAVLVINLAVAAYATFRYVTGPTTAESRLAFLGARQYGFVGSEQRPVGSFAGASTLAAWSMGAAAMSTALCFALRGRWRAVAVAVAALSAFMVTVGTVRTTFAGLVPAVAVVVLLYAITPVLPGPRALVAGGVALLMVVVGGTTLAITVLDNPEQAERFTNLVRPGQDLAYQGRLVKWKAALDDMDRYPLGQGLGTGGSASVRSSRFVVAGQTSIDSSYLKVIVEQGPAVLALMAAGLLALLGAFARAARRARDPVDAGLLIGGAGVLVAALVSFYGANFLDDNSSLQWWVLLGLAMSAMLHPSEGQPPPHARPAVPAA